MIKATPRSLSHWTLVHSHYVLMGGFAFEPPSNKKTFLPLNLTRLTLTPAAVEFLAHNEPTLIPNISKEEINDKSKASALAKTLVCLQASWFCFQCITRIQQGFAITLLELNTFAHAICTLLIYILWWNKPLDIEEPTIIRGENADIICAMMILLDHNNQSHQKFYGTGLGSVGAAYLDYVPSDITDLPELPADLDEEDLLKSFTSEVQRGQPKRQDIPLKEAVIRMENVTVYRSAPVHHYNEHFDASTSSSFSFLCSGRHCELGYYDKCTGRSASRPLVLQRLT